MRAPRSSTPSARSPKPGGASTPFAPSMNRVVSDSLVMEPWSDKEIAKAEAEAAAQWEKLGVDVDQEF